MSYNKSPFGQPRSVPLSRSSLRPETLCPALRYFLDSASLVALATESSKFSENLSSKENL